MTGRFAMIAMLGPIAVFASPIPGAAAAPNTIAGELTSQPPYAPSNGSSSTVHVATSNTDPDASGTQNTIDFSNLPDGTVVTNQYPGVTFSSVPGYVNYVSDQSEYNTPSFICTGPTGGSIDCAEDTILDFTSPVSDLTFDAVGVNDTGQVAQVEVYNSSGLIATVPIIGDAGGYTAQLVDLSAYNNISSIDITDITDAAGIGWTNFSFNSATFSCPSVGSTAGSTTFPPINATGTAGSGTKPWQISYGQLGLTWNVTAGASSTSDCTLTSNLGQLPVLLTIGGTTHQVATSAAIANLNFLQNNPAIPACNFSSSATNSNCLLNSESPNPTVAEWSTSGFTEYLGSGTSDPLPKAFNTGPLTYYVDTSTLSCPSGTVSNDVESVLQCLELYIHETLISNLPQIDSAAIFQEPPGNALVTNGAGQQSGVTADGEVVNNIPQSFVFPAAGTSGGSVFILDPTDSTFSVQATGTPNSAFTLAMSTVNFASSNTPQILSKDVSGSIGVNGASKAYQLAIPAPVITSIKPQFGNVNGGNSVTIRGSGFSTTPGATSVWFGNTMSTSVSCSSTVCSAVAPPHSFGLVCVHATAYGQSSACVLHTLYLYLWLRQT